MRTAIIIGAGVTGLSTAYHLARQEYGRIIILEKHEIGDGSSSRAAGITTGLLWTETGVRVRRHATRIFREFSSNLDGYTYYNANGCLNLFDRELWEARKTLLPLYDRLEVPYQVLTPAQIRQRWPGLDPANDFIGLHDPLGGFSEPSEYLPSLAQAVRGLGVEIREHVRVDEITLEAQRARGVTTSSGQMSADAIVVANYSWVMPLLATVGIRLPVKTFLHQRYVSEPLNGPLRLPPINVDPLLGYIRPAKGNRLLLGIETPDREDFKVPSRDFRLDELSDEPGLISAAVQRFEPLFPSIRGLRWESKHIGLLSFSMDGEPIIGPVPNREGLFVGNCFHSGGFSYSPATGYFLAEFVAKGFTSIDLTAFSPGRFDPRKTEKYLNSTTLKKEIVLRHH